MKKIVIMDIITALVILLFLYASFSKIFDLWYFKYDLAKQPFPKWLQKVLVWAIPFSEVFISVLLMVKRTRLPGLYLALFLMLLFTGYTAAILLHFFAFVPCGCGGVIRMLSWPQHLVFNLFFVVIIILDIWLMQKTLKDKQLQMQVQHLIKIFHARSQVKVLILDKIGHFSKHNFFKNEKDQNGLNCLCSNCWCWRRLCDQPQITFTRRYRVLFTKN